MFQAFQKIRTFLGSHKQLTPSSMKDFEEMLYESDMRVATVTLFLNQLKHKISAQREVTEKHIQDAFRELWLPRLTSLEKEVIFLERPSIVLMVGVNGVGKTTSLIKLAGLYHKQGLKVLMIAADTFRAAASEQLIEWGKRLTIDVFKSHLGVNPSSVVFDGIAYAKRHDIDVILIDTAGRMMTSQPLMAELQKMKKVIQKLVPHAPHETFVALDANVGHNTLVQCRQFHEALGISGLIVTKLDGTAKGGILFTIAEELALPLAYVCAGEKESDIAPFKASLFLETFFSSLLTKCFHGEKIRFEPRQEE